MITKIMLILIYEKKINRMRNIKKAEVTRKVRKKRIF